MDSCEMQAVIDRLRRYLHNLCLLATEPHQTPVHPAGTIDRDEVPATKCATDKDVEAVLTEF
ncbi:hypothetical protein SAMN05421752_10215 [Natronorubrum thiooxidans]|uniref:Uncharacterized protein n=1 Tax=Natronorubrum thiooxidans TaxID=308853 RepID=A0A1N7D6Q8_9EURY|nr:hypothetical protein SAMN05421752_10215 [Natronorubrum thiooxidans]